MSSRRDVGDDYREAAEHLADLVSRIIPALEHAGPRTFGGVWREGAKSALTKFRSAQAASRQTTMFGGADEG